MTRKEQIISEAKKYYLGNIRCYDAFLYGTEFADNNPDLSSLWHDASEIPQKLRDLLLISKDHMSWICDFCDRLDKPDGWEKYVKARSLTMWAYVDDLLPKGGEK